MQSDFKIVSTYSEMIIKKAFKKFCLDCQKNLPFSHDVVFDKCTLSIKQLCFLSYDPDIYFNPASKVLPFDEHKYYSEDRKRFKKTEPYEDNYKDKEFVKTLLSHINPKLEYHDREKVNRVVLYYF